jgi:hypothetical protein
LSRLKSPSPELVTARKGREKFDSSVTGYWEPHGLPVAWIEASGVVLLATAAGSSAAAGDVAAAGAAAGSVVALCALEGREPSPRATAPASTPTPRTRATRRDPPIFCTGLFSETLVDVETV